MTLARVCRAALISVLGGALSFAHASDEKPSWFKSDYKSALEWGFYCESTGKTETEALASARAQCSGKICLLFGVEVDYKSVSTEDLKNASITTQTIERCPNVRVVGRIEKKKSVECSDENCLAYVYQLYPKSEYDREYERLNRPAVSPSIEKTIVIREGNSTFQDPKRCLAALGKYATVRGETSKNQEERLTALSESATLCKELDYRDTNLAGQFMKEFLRSVSARSMSTQLAMNAILTEHPAILDRIAALQKFETELKNSAVAAPLLIAFITEHYDALFGNRGPVDDYLKELKTCAQTRKLFEMWPRGYTQNLQVCRKSTDRPGEVCSSLDYLMMKAKFIGCECNRLAPASSQDCFRLLMTYVDQLCTSDAKSCASGVEKYLKENGMIRK